MRQRLRRCTEDLSIKSHIDYCRLASSVAVHSICIGLPHLPLYMRNKADKCYYLCILTCRIHGYRNSAKRRRFGPPNGAGNPSACGRRRNLQRRPYSAERKNLHTKSSKPVAEADVAPLRKRCRLQANDELLAPVKRPRRAAAKEATHAIVSQFGDQ